MPKARDEAQDVAPAVSEDETTAPVSDEVVIKDNSEVVAENVARKAEEVEVEVQLTGPQPSGPLAAGQPISTPKGTQRTIRDEREDTPDATPVVKFSLEDVDDPDVQRLYAIAGRQFSLLRGGQRAHGFLTLLNVKTMEQIQLFPGGLIPDGKWAPINYLPEAFVASLR